MERRGRRGRGPPAPEMGGPSGSHISPGPCSAPLNLPTIDSSVSPLRDENQGPCFPVKKSSVFRNFKNNKLRTVSPRFPPCSASQRTGCTWHPCLLNRGPAALPNIRPVCPLSWPTSKSWPSRASPPPSRSTPPPPLLPSSVGRPGRNPLLHPALWESPSLLCLFHVQRMGRRYSHRSSLLETSGACPSLH